MLENPARVSRSRPRSRVTRSRSPRRTAVLILSVALPWVAAPLAAQVKQFEPAATRAPESFVPGLSAIRDGLAVADLDADGDQDLIVGDALGVHVAYREPSGWILIDVPLPQGGGKIPFDVDGDGDLDLVHGPRTGAQTNPVGLALRQADGSYQSVPLPALQGLPVEGVAVGDIDGDGDADLVVGMVAGLTPLQALVVVRNSGGSFGLDLFATPGGVPFGCWPALADVDLDGDLDVVAGAQNGGIVLLRNQGNGAFANATGALPPVRIGYRYLCTGDFDGDGRPDIAAAHQGGDLDVLWNDAAGFTAALGLASGVAPQVLVPGDYDGDGQDDLMVLHAVGCERLYHVGGRQLVRQSALNGPTLLASGIGDLDGDGAPDLLFATRDAPDVVQMRAGDGSSVNDIVLSLGFRFPTGVRHHAPTAGDLDGDGRTDLVMPMLSGLAVQMAEGAGRYRLSFQPLIGSGGRDQRVLRDFDGDGDLDLLHVHSGGVAVYPNDGAGVFGAAIASVAAPSGAFDATRVADVDGDGDPDLVRAGSTGVVLYRNGGGVLNATVLVPATAVAPQCLELADLDGDGDLDLITDQVAGAGGVTMLANDGAGVFAPQAGFQLPLDPQARSMAAGDLDGDGDVDLVVARDGTPPFLLFANDGLGGLQSSTQLTLPTLQGASAANIVCADLDEDGDLDLLGVRQQLANGVTVLVNDGVGQFLNLTGSRWTEPAEFTLTPTELAVADLDMDGDLDVLAGGFSSSSFENQTIRYNMLRHCGSAELPRLGGNLRIQGFTGPGFGPFGALVLAIAPAPVAPTAVPGFVGHLQLDPATLQLLSLSVTDLVGVSSTLVAVPVDPNLIGLELYLQNAILPVGGVPGFSNLAVERIVP
ncbi:MAG: FG-GAP repeat domain-containing protein [Planctomycetota bacterium]